VAANEWYLRRQQDDEGEFFHKVADQGPRRKGGTRQGIYGMTASGKFLFYAYGDVAPAELHKRMRLGLAAWDALPETETRPDAVQVPARAKTDNRYARVPPRGGLIVNVYTRSLDHGDKGELCACKEKAVIDQGITIPVLAAYDHLWLTEGEWRSLIPAHPTKGATFPVPEAVARRVFRFHLVDNTRGEPDAWKPEEVRSGKLALTVEEAGAAGVRLRLEGSAVLATRADLDRAERGYEVSLLGYLNYNAATRTLDRFDVVAAGTSWGKSQYQVSRAGKKPLGIAFQLAPGDDPADQVPPQAARDLEAYWGNR
jgi:hypothetical protein